MKQTLTLEDIDDYVQALTAFLPTPAQRKLIQEYQYAIEKNPQYQVLDSKKISYRQYTSYPFAKEDYFYSRNYRKYFAGAKSKSAGSNRKNILCFYLSNVICKRRRCGYESDWYRLSEIMN